MWKAFVAIAVGVVVGVATAMVAFGIFFATTWSGIHSGRTDRPGWLEIVLVNALFFCAAAAPFVLGFLAGRATHYAMGGGVRPGDSS